MKKKLKLVCVLGLSVLVFVGCGAPNKSMSSDSTTAISSEVQNIEELAVAEDVGTVQEPMAPEQGINMSLSSNLNRKIIKTGNLDIQTKTFDETVNDIFIKVDTLGGFIENCDIAGNSYYGAKGYRNASMKVRIPQKQFDTFINGASEFGNVVRRAISAEDITDAYVDTEARIETLEVRRERLLALMEQSGSLDHLFQIEKELANVNYEIETLKGSLGKYDALVDYATIEIFINEVEIYEETTQTSSFWQKVGKVFEGSVDSLIAIVKGVVLCIVAVVPYLVVIGIPVGIIVRIIIRKQKRNKQNDKE
ncbi:MAG: DUF4349 domain-containing protein [Cellulosilyticaceae bacterium]